MIEKVKGKSTRDTNKILDQMNGIQRNKTITLGERLLNKLEKIQKEFGDCSELEAIEALVGPATSKNAVRKTYSRNYKTLKKPKIHPKKSQRTNLRERKRALPVCFEDH